MKPRIGVLALQGDFDAHLQAVERAGGEGVAVRAPEQLADCDALILPGGESTTMGKLMTRYGLDTAVKNLHAEGKPIFGTCAGMILLSKRIASGEMQGGQPLLGLMDIAVARNAFGRQVDSFETDLDVPEVAPGAPLRAVFIRAPYVVEAGPEVETLAAVGDKAVLVRQGNLLAAAFHPELTGDDRLHEYLVEQAREKPR